MKPCNICKGQFKRECMICGCKLEKPKVDEHKREGARERAMMLDGFSRNCIVYGNHTTELLPTDADIKEHRELADQIWEETQTTSINTVAKNHGLTKKQVMTILATKLMQKNEKVPNTLSPEVPHVRRDPAVVAAEIAEIRRKRGQPKPGTFSKMIEVFDDSETGDSGVS